MCLALADALRLADRLSKAAIGFDAALRQGPSAVALVQEKARAFGTALKEYEEYRGRSWDPPQDKWSQSRTLTGGVEVVRKVEDYSCF